jgi:hypothetical protein
MRTSIRSGRCWVPPEWRDPLGLRFYRRGAFIAVAGVRRSDETRAVLADHLPLLPPGEDEAADSEPVPDEASARRMARRLSRLRPAQGVRELARAGFIARHVPGVYAWRTARHGEQVFRISPDGSVTVVAVFRAARIETEPGQWDIRLTASRPW